MAKICVVAPVHNNRDIRIYTKEILTFLNEGYEVVQISRSSEDCINDDLFFEKYTELVVPRYKNRMQRLLLTPWLVKESLKTKADIYHVHNPDTLLLGFILKVFRKKVIYDTHEDFSERILMREYLAKPLRKVLALIITKLEKNAGKYFDLCIVTQVQIQDRIKKSILIENPPKVSSDINDKAIKISKEISKDRNSFRLIYVGGISEGRGIKVIINSLVEVNKYFSCRLWLIGPFMEENLYSQISNLDGWKYIDYLGEMKQEDAFSYMIKSDVGIVTILDIGDHKYTSPNKLFEYQMFSLPFIASNFKTWKRRVEKNKSGIFVNPMYINELVEAIKYLEKNPIERKEMGNRGREYIQKYFNWEIEAEKLLIAYKKILNEKDSNN